MSRNEQQVDYQEVELRRFSDDAGSGSDMSSDGEIKPRVTNPSTVMGACFNFINSIIGAGIIGLPFAIKECGFFMGTLMLFLMAFLTDYSVRLIVSSGVKARKLSFESLCEHTLGRPGFYIVSVFMFIFAFGGMLTYLVIIGDSVSSVMARLAGADTIFANRRWDISLMSLIMVLPLSCLKDMSSLSYTSSISILAVGFILFLTCLRAPDVMLERDPHARPPYLHHAPLLRRPRRHELRLRLPPQRFHRVQQPIQPHH